MAEGTLDGSGGLLRCANNALMDWIMSPSSGQAIIGWGQYECILHSGRSVSMSHYLTAAPSPTKGSCKCNLVQGSCAAGVDVSCSTSLPKSPDRIAGIKKPRRDAEANFTNWYVTIIFMPPLKVKAAYQSRLKYDAFNPVLQDLSINLSPFVVNVIA